MEKIDEQSDLTLVYLKDGSPHCKKHGAMNCNYVTKEGDRLYRCFSAYGYDPENKHKPISQRDFIDRTCEAACIIRKRIE